MKEPETGSPRVLRRGTQGEWEELLCGLWRWGKEQEPRAVGPQELDQAGWGLSLELPGGAQSCQHLGFSPRGSIWEF